MAENVVGGFSDDGAREYRDFYADYRRRAPLHLARPRPVEPVAQGEEPPMYVVLTPPGGIPAMWEETSGGGTGSAGDAVAGTGTGTLGDQGDRPGFADCDAYGLTFVTPGGAQLTHPRLESLGFSVTVYNAAFTAVPGSRFVTAVRDALGQWWADRLPGSSAAAPAGFWARLTGKTYVTGEFIRYTFEPVIDGTSPTTVTWTDGAVSGSYAYEVNNTDLVVAVSEAAGTGTGTSTTQDDYPTIVWMWPSSYGSYYLFEITPRWEFVAITDHADGSQRFPGRIVTWDQYNQQVITLEGDILIFDINAFV